MYGLTLSAFNGSETIYSAQVSDFRSSLSYRRCMPPVKDQGTKPMCVAYALSSILDHGLKGLGFAGHVEEDLIYSSRTIKASQGMSFKEAFLYLENKGVSVEDRCFPVRGSVVINSELLMKDFLLGFGPFVIGVPVAYPDRVEFWRGSASHGYHALTVTGYNSQGLEVLNSWGLSYGDQGYATLKWSDFHYIKEAWGLIW